MSALFRRPAVSSWALALAFATAVLFAGSRDVFWTGDFYLEVYPAYIVLMHGDVGRFFDLLPGYSGFVTVVGAPAALLTGVLHGHETMVYRLTAIPGLIGLSAVGVAIAGPLRAAGNRAWPLFLLLGAGGALTLETMRAGHPEDLLATAAAIAAVLAVRSGRITWASVLIVGAVVSKQSMVVAVLPAAMAAPRGGLRVAAAGLIGTAALVMLQTRVGGPVHGTITNTGLLFHPHQIWWPFGVPATPEFIEAGHGTRMGPEWLAPLTRPMIVGMSFVVSAVWWLRSGSERNRDDVLGLLALVLLLRCMIDPWNLVYYHLPLVIALAAWEARRGRDLPVLSLIATAACWLTFVVYDAHTGYGPFFAYLAWTIPLAAGLAITLLRPSLRRDQAPARRLAAPAPA
jgi:hypothetical protein